MHSFAWWLPVSFGFRSLRKPKLTGLWWITQLLGRVSRDQVLVVGSDSDTPMRLPARLQSPGSSARRHSRATTATEASGSAVLSMDPSVQQRKELCEIPKCPHPHDFHEEVEDLKTDTARPGGLPVRRAAQWQHGDDGRHLQGALRVAALV